MPKKKDLELKREAFGQNVITVEENFKKPKFKAMDNVEIIYGDISCGYGVITAVSSMVSSINDSGGILYWVKAIDTRHSAWYSGESLKLAEELIKAPKDFLKPEEDIILCNEEQMNTLRETNPKTIGDTLLDLETVLDSMCDQGLQLGDILALVHSHIWTHRQDAIEVYEEDNSRPVLKYGHKDQI